MEDATAASQPGHRLGVEFPEELRDWHDWYTGTHRGTSTVLVHQRIHRAEPGQASSGAETPGLTPDYQVTQQVMPLSRNLIYTIDPTRLDLFICMENAIEISPRFPSPHDLRPTAPRDEQLDELLDQLRQIIPAPPSPPPTLTPEETEFKNTRYPVGQPLTAATVHEHFRDLPGRYQELAWAAAARAALTPAGPEQERLRRESHIAARLVVRLHGKKLELPEECVRKIVQRHADGDSGVEQTWVELIDDIKLANNTWKAIFYPRREGVAALSLEIQTISLMLMAATFGLFVMRHDSGSAWRSVPFVAVILVCTALHISWCMDKIVWAVVKARIEADRDEDRLESVMDCLDSEEE